MKGKSSMNQPGTRKRRTTSKPTTEPVTQAHLAWVSDVQENGINSPSSRQCPKCQGFLLTQPIDLTPLNDIRCVNCGWQPQWGTRIVKENEEVRSIRRFTAQCVSDIDTKSQSKALKTTLSSDKTSGS